MACDVMFSVNGCLLNEDVLTAWLAVKSESDCVAELVQRGALKGYPGAEVYCVAAEVHEHYCLFELIERHILSPSNNYDILDLNDAQRKLIIERYYEYDTEIVRELLGKKLTGRTKKDLEELANKLGIHTRSCKRQFDNVRRILKSVEDMPGRVQHNIQAQFGLNDDLAEKYACIVFMCVNRFETSKKKLQCIGLPDFLFCTQQMMQHWVPLQYPFLNSWTNLEVDKPFLQELKCLKLVLEKDNLETIIKFVADDIVPKLPLNLEQDFNNNARSYLKTTVNLAVELCHKGDLRDFFLDLVEKIGSPLKMAGWSDINAMLLLNTIHGAVSNFDPLKSDKGGSVVASWKRYMNVLENVTNRIYQALEIQ